MSFGIVATARMTRARVIHHHHGYRLGELDGPLWRLRLPLVVSLHGHDVTTYATQYPGAMEGVLGRADAVIIPSRFLADRVEALGVRSGSIRVIPSGVDVDVFRPTPLPDGPPEALFVGRFVEKKGIDVLLRAWSKVQERIPDARLRVLGFGPLEAQVRSAGSAVEFEPADPRRRGEQVVEAIRRARLVVTPSRTAPDGDVETLLLVNLEAQASGRPVVSTYHGGIPEYVDDGRTGILVPENDVPALAEALVRVLTDDGLAERLGAAGPVWVKRFDVRVCTARVDDLYDELSS